MKQNYIYIGYKQRELKDSIYLSRFFQICGYQVHCELLLDDIFVLKEDEQFDINIILTKDIETFYSDRKNTVIYNSAENDKINVYNRVVKRAIQEIENKGIISNDTFSCLDSILKIYEKENLGLHEYNSEYFFFDRDIAEKESCVFNVAIKEIEDSIENENLEESLIRFYYAKYYLEKRRLEKLRDLNFQIKDNIKLLVERLLELQRFDKAFVSIYMLIGDVLALDLANTNTALEYYNRYFEIAQKNICTSAVYYRCGRLLESHSSSLERAFKAYYLSYDIDKNNYRSAYKLGIYYSRIDDSIEKAVNLYGAILNKLYKLKNNGYIQPIELEYLFKILFLCGRIYGGRLNSYHIARDYFAEAKNMENISWTELEFLKDMYGNEAKNYLDKIIARFPMRQVEINRQAAIASI